MRSATLNLSRLGPIPSAKIDFGDLTVFTGPQATGKSVALQTLKLALDQASIVRTMHDQGLVWDNRGRFLDHFFGEGMRSLWSQNTSVSLDGRPWRYSELKSPRSEAVQQAFERVSYVPAQRVMSLQTGWTRPFSDYKAGDPYVLREFSQRIHEIVQGELSRSDVLFPHSQRFNSALRNVVTEHVLRGFQLEVDSATGQKRFVIRDGRGDPNQTPSLPFLTWSAGQREFVPLLLGLYRLMPPSRFPRRGHLEWAVIEEPEMGLHPRAIAATMAFVLELVRRGYRVVVSTHSTQVLDVIWGLKQLQQVEGEPSDVLRMINLRNAAQDLGKSALSADLRTYFFDRDAPVVDISELDPGSERPVESGWGGIAGFSGHVADVVADVVIRKRSREHVG